MAIKIGDKMAQHLKEIIYRDEAVYYFVSAKREHLIYACRLRRHCAAAPHQRRTF